jgi:hypothetical protein
MKNYMDIINSIRYDDNKTIVGLGGYGTVYTTPTMSSYCLKISNKKGDSCRKWSDEYSKIESLISKIKSSKRDIITPTCEILQPLSYREDGMECFMLTKRVMRPDKNNSPTIQAQFGVSSCNLVHKGRGQFIGLKEIRYIFNNNISKNTNTLQEIVSDLGILMGNIHFYGKNDAFDIELWLGTIHSGNDPKIKLFLSDFDLSEPIETYDKETIKRMVWSLETVPYFPIASANKVLFDIFAKSYKNVASKLGLGNIADEVIKLYEE